MSACKEDSGSDPASTFGTIMNAFSLVSLMFGAVAIAGKFYMSQCPSEIRIAKLRAILDEWETWLANLSTLERQELEAQSPGLYKHMEKSIRTHKQLLGNIAIEYKSAATWSTYAMTGDLAESFRTAEGTVHALNVEFTSSTGRIRSAQNALLLASHKLDTSQATSHQEDTDVSQLTNCQTETADQICLGEPTALPQWTHPSTGLRTTRSPQVITNIDCRRVTLLSRIPLAHIKNINMRNAIVGTNYVILSMLTAAGAGRSS
ncbi:hypothetical protein C8Q79DRAFT_1012234 [Trametes meyenii]|nr:hypothetical protein C8Q79DRAFT_1012234 [Trametes meyenii]